MFGTKKDKNAKELAEKYGEATRRVLEATTELIEVAKKHEAHTDPELREAIAKVLAAQAMFQVTQLIIMA